MSKQYHLVEIGLITALLLCFYVFNPELRGFFPECPFHSLFALDCPGCGSMRAIGSLLQGEFLKAADYNVMLVISIPLVVIHLACKRYLYFSKKEIRFKVMDSPLIKKVYIGLLVAFWLLRNIPAGPFLYLAA